MWRRGEDNCVGLDVLLSIVCQNGQLVYKIHTHGQITLYLFVHRSTYKERGVDVIARTAYMLKHGTE